MCSKLSRNFHCDDSPLSIWLQYLDQCHRWIDRHYYWQIKSLDWSFWSGHYVLYQWAGKCWVSPVAFTAKHAGKVASWIIVAKRIFLVQGLKALCWGEPSRPHWDAHVQQRKLKTRHDEWRLASRSASVFHAVSLPADAMVDVGKLHQFTRQSDWLQQVRSLWLVYAVEITEQGHYAVLFCQSLPLCQAKCGGIHWRQRSNVWLYTAVVSYCLMLWNSDSIMYGINEKPYIAYMGFTNGLLLKLFHFAAISPWHAHRQKEQMLQLATTSSHLVSSAVIPTTPPCCL